MFKFNLFDSVKDTITGFEGVIVGRTEWLNGRISYSVQPTKLKDNVPQDHVYLDEEQIEFVS